ncbi:hypothetical protein GCM10010435_41050 [Winogradskya consettensis]|uniref:YbaB/EbfC DNA-binding family protein n=1 Tax=Winogradskya consettensis TaxID=113560 RepID=A0A919SFL7_9ACTN|nr:YbaB/EbfC family nucleoid-associated protein [Actinoplanes consettensis]GIM69813.1 hypothetical protein Aco04nite_17180 [Actinoplanes consettensis]
MSTGQDRLLENLFEEYQQQRSKLTDLHRQMREISATAVSPRHEVSVTASHTEGVTDIRFTGSGYRRLAPQELSDLVMATVREARDKARDEAATVIAPVLPEGMNARDLVSGRIGADQLMPADGPRLPTVVREHLERKA